MVVRLFDGCVWVGRCKGRNGADIVSKSGQTGRPVWVNQTTRRSGRRAPAIHQLFTPRGFNFSKELKTMFALPSDPSPTRAARS